MNKEEEEERQIHFFLRKWLDFIDILFLLPSPDRHSLKKEKIHISSQEK